MSRSKNHVASRMRKKRILKFAKGYFGARKNVWTVAKNAVEKGFCYSYRDRKVKKREFRSLWIQRINAAVRFYNLSYSKFIHKIYEKKIKINRKILADLAVNNSEIFKIILQKVNL
jgi:large subunit ribosomal protein L20